MGCVASFLFALGYCHVGDLSHAVPRWPSAAHWLSCNTEDGWGVREMSSLSTVSSATLSNVWLTISGGSKSSQGRRLTEAALTEAALTAASQGAARVTFFKKNTPRYPSSFCL